VGLFLPHWLEYYYFTRGTIFASLVGMFLLHTWDYFCLTGWNVITSHVGLFLPHWLECFYLTGGTIFASLVGLFLLHKWDFFCLRGKALLLSLPSSELFQLTPKATDDIRSFVLLILLNIVVRYTSSVAEKGYKVS
jgi:hypothetical protein